jgi:gamma-glutamyltranspeptidase/glutathione hydrolase
VRRPLIGQLFLSAVGRALPAVEPRQAGGQGPPYQVQAFSNVTEKFLRMGLFGLLAFCAAAHAVTTPPGYAVASAHPAATAAGIEILQAGGSAFDAAVAVSAALAVVEPTGSGLGGGGFWLLHRADGFETFVDGRETAPLAATADMYLGADGVADSRRARTGPLAAAIPGEPAALDYLAKKYGRLPLGRLLAPAIRLARDGFALDSKLANALAQQQSRLSPAAREQLIPQGSAPAVGTLILQPDLASTLERLAAQGRRGFYEGETAQALIAGVRAAGGIWSEEDLRRYQVVERAPTVSYFRDYRVVSAPPPSAGGIGLAEILQQLEILGWPSATATTSRHLSIEAMRRAYRDRADYLGDPDFVAMPRRSLTSRSYARELAQGISLEGATPSSALQPAAPGREGPQTTHFSVMDAEGNRVAATLSINLPFGSGYMAPGTGVLLNDEMDDFSSALNASNAYGLIGSAANAIAPGKRPLSSMSPTFVDGPRGVLALGTPGGSRIITMVLLGVLGFTEGLNAQEIVSMPRYHHQFLPDEVQFEPGAWNADEQAGLKALGHNLKPLTQSYGNLQVVLWQPAENRLQAASDPRGVGAAQVVLNVGASN